MKLITFLYPYNIRNTEAPYLWLMYKMLKDNSADDIHFIGSEEYFKSKEETAKRWETRFIPEGYAASGYIPNKYIIDRKKFNDLENEKLTPNLVWKDLILNPYPPLEKELDKIIGEITSKEDISAIVTMCNCKSLCNVAEKYNLKVIHVELGALRKDKYINTAYFDFSGCNGNTESEKRYLNFRKEVTGKEDEYVIMREKLVDFITLEKEKSLNIFSKKRENTYELGVPLQVEEDSNMIAYSNSFNNIEVMSFIKKHFNEKNVLVRKHPFGRADYKVKNSDTSKNSYEFIKKCKRIATINSSVGLEAMLYNKPTFIFGENPFKFIADSYTDILSETRTVQDVDAKLTFAILCYLVPFDIVLNKKYINFRLSEPSEIEIYKYHYNYWINNKNV